MPWHTARRRERENVCELTVFADAAGTVTELSDDRLEARTWAPTTWLGVMGGLIVAAHEIPDCSEVEVWHGTLYSLFLSLSLSLSLIF